MKIVLRTICLLGIISCLPLLYTSKASAGIDLPWSTTFNCPDWTSYNSPLNCDGLVKWGSWTCYDGTQNVYEQIVSGGNYSGGKGSSGLRHFIGSGNVNNSGSTAIYFNTPQRELWVRWYIRFEKGWTWSGLKEFKMLYFYTDGSLAPYFNFPWGDNNVRLYTQGGGGTDESCTNCGWQTLYGGTASDGSWHAFEVHLKLNNPGTTDGIFEFWIDGVRKIGNTNVNYTGAGNPTGFVRFELGDNGSNFWPTPGCHPVDYDDVAISNTGYIGPLSDAARPSAPTSLR